MSVIRVNNITNRDGSAGPTIAGVGIVSSTSHMVVPTGRTGQRYADEGENIARDGLVLYLDAKYSYPSKTGIGTTTSGAAATAGSSLDGEPYTWYDMSGYENHGQLLNNVSDNLVGYNSANDGFLIFDGRNDHILVNQSDSLWSSNSYTLEVWANRSGSGTVAGRGIVMSKDSNYIDINFNSGTFSNRTFMSVYVRDGGGGAQQPIVISSIDPAGVGTWRHYVATFDGEVARLYENGSLTGSASIYPILTATNATNPGRIVEKTSTPLRLGGYDGGNYYFNGKIGISRLYNRALSAAEVLQNFNANRSRYSL